MKQLLFLDIDGVLNCKKSKTYYSISNAKNYSIDENLWNNLEYFLQAFPDIKVVIHSGWIKHKDEPNYEWDMGQPEKGIKVKTLLPEVIKRLGNRYIGCVDYIKGKPKSYRIEKWLKDHNIIDNSEYNVIVIDDDTSEYTNLVSLEQHDNVFVYFTNSYDGLDFYGAKYLKAQCNSF